MPPEQVWSERTGIDDVDELMNPLRRWGWPRVPAQATTEVEAPPKESPRHRIVDDMNTAGNRSGGPAGAYARAAGGVQDQNADRRLSAGQYTGLRGAMAGAEQFGPTSRMSELRSELAKAEQPPPRPGIKRGLLQTLADIGPTLAAAATGRPGATQGASARMEEGVKRRQSVADLEKTRQFQMAQTLRQEIEQESLEQERLGGQYQTERMREEMQQRGLTERERMQQELETGREERLRQTLEQRDRAITERGEQAAALEDRRQLGRMALQRLRQQGAESVARIHAATAAGRVPPPVARAADDFESSQSRLDVMQKAYEAASQDPSNQQAMLNLLSNHLGMTMGLQHGARISQAIYNEAVRSGVLTERVEAHFGPDGYMTGVVLTPRQMGQMMTLAQDRLQEDYRRMSDWEAYTGFKPNAPMRPTVPGGAGAPGGAGGGTPATGAAGGAKPAHKAGDTVQYKGKPRTVKEVLPDGRLVLNP